MKKIIGLAIIALGIFLEVMWLGFVFGSIIIGVLLLIFAPRILFFPFNFFLLIGLRLIYAQAFKQFEEARRNGQSYSGYSNYSRGSGSHQRARSVNKMQDYYAELESNASDDFSVIKKNYRRLMKEHHYDSLVSKGLPKDMLEFSEEKTKRLNEAYAAIKEARG
ncbi:MAG: Co-chaperone protein DjlA [uncultured Sulfurimonas sp.]|nr:MAG: Co-chaperone protein DjlA [uncultured Sulfurimonas sp.]CAI6155491.1 MAG: Co-chaperone protein DjlA [uncultured Sulfurimonas sp.]